MPSRSRCPLKWTIRGRKKVERLEHQAGFLYLSATPGYVTSLRVLAVFAIASTKTTKDRPKGGFYWLLCLGWII